MSVQIDKFTSSSGLHTVFLLEEYIHGVQTWVVRAEKPDGSRTDKNYISPREAKRDFEKLRERLTRYEPRDVVA